MGTHAYACVTGTRQQKPRAQGSHFEQCRTGGVRRRVTNFPVTDIEPREFISAAVPVDLGAAIASEGNSQHDHLIADVWADIDGRRELVVIRHPKRRPIGKHASRAPQSELADGEKVAFELELGEAPTVRHQCAAARFDVACEVPILLLKVLWL